MMVPKLFIHAVGLQLAVKRLGIDAQDLGGLSPLAA
jgi:hypothetical protein